MDINIGGAEDSSSMDFRQYTDWEEMLAHEEFDMVDVCLPAFLHVQTAIELLKRGYHVLSEKPMALDYEQSMTMVEAANQAKGQLMIGQCLRFASSYTFFKFEQTTVVLGSEGVTVYPRGGEAYKPELSDKSFYEAEIEFFADMVESGAANVVNPPSSAATTIKLIDTLREGARSGGSVVPIMKG